MKRILLFTIMCLFGLFSLNAQEAPQNLVATVNGQNSITVTWDAVEGAEDYYVYKDGTMWANTSGATTYTENGLAAGTECCFAVQAVGAAGESELSAEVCATTESIELAENEIIIGTATTKYYSPFLTILGGGSWFEAIYKSEEIGKACTISELAFSYKDGAETSADINIYLAETVKDEYANPADATAESELTLVYSGNGVTLCDEEWETFVLNAPFNYSGENNLVVVVTTENTSKANNWNCYSDPNTVLIKDVMLDSKKPVLKLTLGEGGETPDPTPDPEPGDLCVVEFILGDSYGDGWNGNTLVVTGSDGVSEVLGLTGGSSTTYTLQFAKGAHVTLLFTNNGNTYTYPQENSLIVRYESGIEIINQAEGSLTSGLTFEFDVDCTPVAPEVPTVVAQTLSDTEIALTLTAAGAETFTVYQGTEVLVENYAETTYVVSGLTPETEYCFTAKSFNEVGESELSEEVCATTYKEGTMIVQVGESDGHTAWSTPVADYYYYSMSQTIYTAEEIGVGAGSIVSVAYNKASGAHNTRNISVYMKNTDMATLTAWDSFTSDMCVYNGTYTFGEPGWNTIDLQEAFSYEGGNLLVCVVDNTAVNATSYDMFYTYKPGVQRAIYGQSSSAPIDPSNTTINYLPIYDNSYAVRSPQTKFVIEASGETPTPSIAAPQNLVATVNGQNSITVTWDAVEGAEDYYVYKDGTMWANTSGATTYTENGLAAGTECCFAVQAVGAAGESELSAEVCATTESIELAENEIIIGTATTKYYSPFLTILGGGSWFEAIYKSEEIGKACTISELAFSYKDGAETSADINIYLAETVKDEYANPADATAESELTLVYSGNGVTLCDEEWETFVLNAPFNYSGENNLVVVVTTENTSKANNWNCYEDANSVLIKDVFSDSKKPVMKLTLGEESEEPETPVVILPYRLESITSDNSYDNLYYVYNEKGQVTQVNEGSYATLVEYNADGTVAKTTYAFLWNGELDYSSNYTVTDYTYTEGVLTSYTKTEIISWGNPLVSEYALTYNEDGTVAKVTEDGPYALCTYAYEYVDGKLVKETCSYYDQWAGVDVSEYIKEFEYDENGNCVTETKYDAYNNPPVPLEGVDYFYDWNIPVDSVHVFAYPHEVLPTRAYLVAKALRYYYRENGETGEVTKDNFEVKTYNYNEEVANFPLPPVNLAAKVLSDTEVELTWETLDVAEYYNVRCNDELIAETTETSYTVENLTAGTEYCFTVTIIKSVAVDEMAESALSNEACATTIQLVNIVPNAIAFGDVKMGEFWTETSTGVEVKIDLLGKTITSIATDNDFFRVPATINLNEEPITFKVDYKKGAEAGEYTGNLLVMVDSCYTVSIPLSATAYNPVAPDVFELAQEIEFVEGAYTDAPDFATLHDDYNLPNEAEGNNPDAVYTFTLDTESVVNVEVTGENAVYATYKAFGEEEGPTAANAFFGEETILSTSFSYDFESADLSDFTIVDNDEFKDYTWTVENGSLVSYSFVYDYETYAPIANDADERLITNKAYAITANSVLTLDINVNGSGGNFNFGEAVFIEVTQDGETFTQVGVAYDDETTYSYEFMSKRINIGAKFAELGLEYGEYQIVLHHDQTAYGAINVDNLALTERANVYPAGTYYLVAASASAFEVNVEVAVQEMPVAPKPYRLVSKESGYSTTSYLYDVELDNRVLRIDNNGMIDYLNYNAQGQLESYFSVLDSTIISEVNFVYDASNRLVSYTETTQSQWGGNYEYEYVISYNAEGKVEQVVYSYGAVATYEYNAEGLLIERAVGSDYDGEVSYDSKEVYTYQNGKLVKIEYMNYDWNLADGSFTLVEEVVYEYDLNGNCVSGKRYEVYENDVKVLYQTTEYYYNTEVLAEDVYTFEYPHFAFSDIGISVKPSSENVLTKEVSYYSYVDEATGEVVNHSHTYTTYNYDPEILSVPFAPTNLVATAVNTSEIVLSWDAVSGADYYNVYYDGLFVGQTSETTFLFGSFGVNIEHCFVVVAENAAGVSEYSDMACVTTYDFDDVCYVYFELADTYGDGWNGNYLEVAYNGKTQKLEMTGGSSLEHVLEIPTGSYVTVTYIVSQGYTWPEENSFVVRYENGAKILDMASGSLLETTFFEFYVDCSTAAPTAPEAPTNLVAEVKSSSEIQLSWDDVEGAEYYNIYSGDVYLGYIAIPVCIVSNVEYGTHCYTVTAVNEAGESEHSNEACATIEDPIKVHNQALTSGWNWYSTYVVNEGAEGLANLENAVGTNGIQIKNQSKFVNQAGGNWYGTLTETSVEDMFMIQMSSATNVALEGYEVNPAEHPITLGTNWKWISYPLSTEMSVEEAFASANPSNGDYVKSQTGFAQYYDGLGWSGTLTSMTPGMGYMYQNVSGSAKTLVYPSSSSKGSMKSNVTTDNNHWTADYAKYPMNMTMIAVVEGAESAYEVAAFADGECRGSARPIYVEALDSYIMFMTISGEDGETLTFKYYDVNTGETYAIADEFTFSVNATVGDVMNPYVMTRGAMGIDELSSSINIYPNPVDNELFLATEFRVEEIAIYDVYGRQAMSQQVNETTSQQVVEVADLEAGVYFVKVVTSEGEIVKRFVKK